MTIDINAVEQRLNSQPDQRTKEWRDQRVSLFTASEIHRLLTPVYEERDMTPEELAARPKKGKGSATTKVKTELVNALSAGALTYVYEKVAEHFTGVSRITESRATAWGEEMEPLAKEHYKIKYGREILPAYFVPFSTISGGTPDGYTDDVLESFNADIAEILIEIKCPYESHNMIRYWTMELQQFIDEHFDYYAQIQFNMLVTGKLRGRMVFFDPRQPDHLQMCYLDVPQDAELQSYIVKKIMAAEKVKQSVIKAVEFKSELQFKLY